MVYKIIIFMLWFTSGNYHTLVASQHKHFFCNVYLWPSIGKPGTTRQPSKHFFLHLRSCRRPDIELSKFYRCSLSRSRYNRPNRSLPSAWNNTFLRNRSIFSRYLRTPRCARFSRRRSHFIKTIFFYMVAMDHFIVLILYNFFQNV